MENNRVDTEKSWRLLREGILRNTLSGSGAYKTEIEGFVVYRHINNQYPKPQFFQPVIIVVAQGEKLVRIGNEEFKYGGNICFVAGTDMPLSSCVMQASEERPCLSMSLNLNTDIIASLATRIPPPIESSGSITAGAMIQKVDPDLLDAFLRLLELAQKPQQIPIMQELLIQEIHYRLLTGPFGHILRTLNTAGSHGHQVSQAISWLKDNYKEPLLVEKLAGRSNMAPSTFYRYFKDVTTLSPLQYQKRLRLIEAQRLMLMESYDVTEAALTVGYESSSQFIREYKRLFGEPPRRNIVHLKNMAQDYGQSMIAV